MRDDNRPIEAALLSKNHAARGYTPAHISASLQKLKAAADTTGITLYQANLRTDQCLIQSIFSTAMISAVPSP